MMTVEQLIEKLMKYPSNAETSIVVHNEEEAYTITWAGDGEGDNLSDAKRVHFYVDRLCQSETRYP